MDTTRGIVYYLSNILTCDSDYIVMCSLGSTKDFLWLFQSMQCKINLNLRARNEWV